MNYIFELVESHHLTGNFDRTNLIDYKLAKKYRLTRKTKKKKTRLSNYFFGCIKSFVKLGLIKEYDDCRCYKTYSNNYFARIRYNINKNRILIFYCIVLTLDDASKRDRNNFNEKNCDSSIEYLLKAIENLGNHNYVLYNKVLNKSVEYIYSLLATIFLKACCIKDYTIVEKFNSYTNFYINQINNNKIKPLNFAPITKHISISWFTDYPFSEYDKMYAFVDEFDEQYQTSSIL